MRLNSVTRTSGFNGIEWKDCFPVVLLMSLIMGTASCGRTKFFDEWSICGNGIIEPGEECDGYNLGGHTCESLGRGTGTLGCTKECTFDFSGCAQEEPVCGNGIIELGEECDGSDLGGQTCESLGWERGTLGCTTDCRFDLRNCEGPGPVCGNGVIEYGEACDGEDLGGRTCESLGYDSGILRCNEDCRFDVTDCEGGESFCGNGVMEPGEECDGWDLGGQTCQSLGYDGGNLYCSALCTLETSGCYKEDCGNGMIDPGEQCDGTNLGNETCQTLGYDGGSLGCTDMCTFDTSGCHKAECGNGLLEPGEECDDGPHNSDTEPDRCRTDCRLPWCGDGVVDTGEQCDGTNLGGATCQSLGYDGGVLACRNNCTFDVSGCYIDLLTCGNGVIEPGEQCDGTNLGGQTCQSLGYDGGVLSCNDDCTFNTGGCYSYECGNGVIDPGEQCDGTNLGGQTCQSLGYDGGVLSCNDDCTFNTGGCYSYECGNGVIDPGEQCDGTNLGGQTCQSLGYDGGVLSCNDDCTFNTGGCYSYECGNGVIDPGEQCDGTNLGGATCVWLGYDGGSLGCNDDCTFDVSDCYHFCVPDWPLNCGGWDSWSTEWIGSTHFVDSYSCVGWNESGREYTYYFNAGESNQVTVVLSASNPNLDVFVIDGTDGCDPMNCIAYGSTSATFFAEAGRTYYIVVDGRNGASGNYSISMFCGTCGNGILEYGEECDEGSNNEDRYGLVVWQDSGLFLPIHPIQRWTSAVNFYSYVSASAHTGYEAPGRSLAFLYRDYNTGIMSLFFVHGIDYNTSGEVQPVGELEFEVVGLPEGTSLGLSDDPGEFYQDGPTSYYGDWWFLLNTDGGIIQGISFPDSWDIVVRPTWKNGITEWVWVDENSHFHQLDMSRDLFISADDVPVLCRTDCTLPLCGDGILDPGEMCDDGNNIDGDGCAADCMSMP